MDPDGDTLVYDWQVGGGIRLKGAHNPNDHFLFHKSENTQIVYAPDSITAVTDTFWVRCTARDVKGGSDRDIVFLIVTDKDFSWNEWRYNH